MKTVCDKLRRDYWLAGLFARRLSTGKTKVHSNELIRNKLKLTVLYSLLFRIGCFSVHRASGVTKNVS